MSGTSSGARKGMATRRQRLGLDFDAHWREQSRKGGRVKVPKGFSITKIKRAALTKENQHGE